MIAKDLDSNDSLEPSTKNGLAKKEVNGETVCQSTNVDVPFNSMEEEELKEMEKDGLYGWLIVLSTFMQHFVVDGVTYTFSIFYVDMAKEFPASSKAELATILSIFLICTHGGGPLGSMLINKFGLRKASISGSVVATIGFSSSYFAPNVHAMYGTVGVIAGFGFCLLYMTSIVAIPAYFDKRLSIAMGIALCGTGLGTLFCEWALELALSHFNWRITMAMVGGVTALTIIFGLPHVRSLKKKNVKENKSEQSSLSDDSNGKRKGDNSYCALMDWDLLRKVQFLLYAAGDCFLCAGFFVSYIYWPEFERKYTHSLSTRVLGFVGGGNVFGRIVLGFLNDQPYINSLYLSICMSVTSGTVVIVSLYVQSEGLLWACAAIFGTAMGTYIILRPVVLVELFGRDKLTSAFGFLMVMHASGLALGPIVSGYLYEYSGCYVYSFYFGGLSILISSFLVGIIPFFKNVDVCSSPQTT